jgi:hypothetical protein
MKKLIPLMFLMAWAPSGLADQCSMRVLRLASPVFPKTLEEIQALERLQRCSVDIAYSINAYGRAENIDYHVANPACRLFNIAAIRAVRSSQFTEGEYVHLCFTRLTFEMRDGQVSWGYY